jgi:hypothetical protein
VFFGEVRSICTAVCLGLVARPSTVLTRENVNLHKSLSVVWTVQPRVRTVRRCLCWFGQGLCDFYDLYCRISEDWARKILTHRSRAVRSMIGGPFACIKVRRVELEELMLAGHGPSAQGWRTIGICLFWQIWQISNGKTSLYLYDVPSGPRARTIHECAERGKLSHNI